MGRRRGIPSQGRSTRSSPLPLTRAAGVLIHQVPQLSRAGQARGSRRKSHLWSTSAPVLPHSGSSGPASASASLPACQPRRHRAQSRRGRPDPRYRDHPRGVRRRPRRPRGRRRPARDLHQVAGPVRRPQRGSSGRRRRRAGREVVRLTAEEAVAGLQINFFWVIVSSINFVIFLPIIWTFAFKPVAGMLAERKERIEQGLKDAEAARRDGKSARPSASPPWPRRVAKRTTSWCAPRRRPRRVGTPTSPRRGGTRADARSRGRRDRGREGSCDRGCPLPMRSPKSSRSSAAGRVVVRFHDGRSPAPPRRGVPHGRSAIGDSRN